MSELNKTTCFFVAALAAMALAIFTRPSVEEFDVEELSGKLLVEDFSTDAPKRLRITSLNEETGEIDSFEVAEQEGVWSIPSKSGYPADATEQMAAAVEGVVGLEILDVVSAGPAEHVTFGVVDPTDSTADEGFGTHIELVDGEDNVLADLIVGEEVKDRPGLHWVRKSKQDVVYAVEVDLEKFSTSFDKWIERDLLGLSTFDVSEVYIDDYSSDMLIDFSTRPPRPQLQKDARARMHLTFNDEENKWQVKSLEQFNADTGTYEAFELAEDEELNEDALRELKNALDDLEIVDVERKPDGLSADLQAGQDFMNSNETIQSLLERGFLPWPKEPGNPQTGLDLQSSEGEIIITLNDGVEYVMRFGDLQIDASEEATNGDAADGEEDAEAEEDAGLNRYLFVMARFNEGALEPPKLEELPELPAEDPAAETETGESEANNESEEETPEQGEEKPTREQVEAERKRIEENNKRAEEEYNERVKAGQERVEELNARFGDWYYVIPNDVFKKIHLGRDEVVEMVVAEEAGNDPNASEFGAPGTPIPGLPDLGASDETSSDETVMEETVAEESSDDQPGSDEATSDDTEVVESSSSEESATEDAVTDEAVEEVVEENAPSE